MNVGEVTPAPIGVETPRRLTADVVENGNADGFFNKVAGAKPLVLVPKAIEVVKVLESLKP